MIGGFPPKLPPREEWISLCSALTWLQCNHALELDELLEWASQAWITDTASAWSRAEATVAAIREQVEAIN